MEEERRVYIHFQRNHGYYYDDLMRWFMNELSQWVSFTLAFIQLLFHCLILSSSREDKEVERKYDI